MGSTSSRTYFKTTVIFRNKALVCGPPKFRRLNRSEISSARIMLGKFNNITKNKEKFVLLASKIETVPKTYIDTVLPFHDEILRFNNYELLQNIVDELSYVERVAETYGFIHVVSLDYVEKMLRVAMRVAKEMDDDVATQATTEAFEATKTFAKLVYSQKTLESNEVFVLKETPTVQEWFDVTKM